MSEDSSSKRIRKPAQQFESWSEGDKHAPDSIRQRKRREKLKGKEVREKQKEKKKLVQKVTNNNDGKKKQKKPKKK